MESFFSRNRNLIVLLVVLAAQLIGLAVQVRRPGPADLRGPTGVALERRDGRGVLLIRVWASSLVTPFELAIHVVRQGVSGMWTNYVDLHRTREENRQLKETVDRLRLEQAELREDALQGQRLQALLKFREGYIYETVAAQVIGTSGSTASRLIWLDKGSKDGLKQDMAVISSDGIVGKVRDVFDHSAQVLLINDQTSGAGVVLATTRTRGILRGNAAGQPQVIDLLADQRIQPGEAVLTAGGDQIFPRGLPVGVVESIQRDPERSSFIDVVVKPAANLQHLDEVLVITSLEPHLSPQQLGDLATSEELKGAEVAAEAERRKAAAEMAERLPSIKDPSAPEAPGADENSEGAKAAPAPAATVPKPLPAKHPDRFSPGGETDEGAAAADAKPVVHESPPGAATSSASKAGRKSAPAAEPRPAPKQAPGPAPLTPKSPGRQP